ncbi:twin-arginine translocase TatA/TatE family subunit [Opitutaceae bacterium EW11]|nr:twin-arginine translocase TatA/TatE family subunit [Opitutaceae bacterium EW11]
MNLPVFAFLDVGTPELLLIMFAILLLFGGERLPSLARGLGKSIREFKKASAGVEEEIKRAIEAAPEPSTKTRPVTPANTISTTAKDQPALSPAHVESAEPESHVEPDANVHPSIKPGPQG